MIGNLRCLKLQCLGCDIHTGLPNQAHRALDDAQMLRSVVAKISGRLGISVSDFISQASRSLDAEGSEANLACLVERRQPNVEEEDSPLEGVTSILSELDQHQTPLSEGNRPSLPCGSDPVRRSAHQSNLPATPLPSRPSTTAPLAQSFNHCRDNGASSPLKSPQVSCRPALRSFDWRQLEHALQHRPSLELGASKLKAAPTTPPRRQLQPSQDGPRRVVGSSAACLASSNVSPFKTKPPANSIGKRGGGAIHDEDAAGAGATKRICRMISSVPTARDVEHKQTEHCAHLHQGVSRD